MIKTEIIESYKEYGKCLSISNGVIEAYVTIEIGPRIIKFGYVDGQNFMNDNRTLLGGLPEEEEYSKFFGQGKRWENLGGHRIWLSPESYPETYTPDDKPCTYEITENGAIFTYSEDTEIGVQKSMELKMDKDDANMQVLMKIKNITDKDMEFSVWALSVCSQNGTLIIPTNTNDTGLLNNRVFAIWPYTDMRDDRLYFGGKYVTVRQDKDIEQPAKLGFDLNNGEAYYVLGEDILYKRYDTSLPGGNYPDGGCSFETYVCGAMIEFETLGELKVVKSGETNEHIENWSLFKTPCEVDFKNDDSIDNLLSKI